jgi:CRISPR-associated endonuclease/helicase Cas3
MLDVAAAAYVLWERHVSAGQRWWITQQLGLREDEARRFVAFLAGLHDLGKAVWPFQQSVGRKSPDFVPHERVTFWTLPTLLDPDFASAETPARTVAYRMGELLGGHHGTFPTPELRTVRDPARQCPRLLGGPEWQRRRAELVKWLRTVVDAPQLPDELQGAIAAVLTGVVVLADWIASDTQWITDSQWSAPIDPAMRWEHTLATVAARVDALLLSSPQVDVAAPAEQVVRNSLNPLQSSLDQDFRPTEAGLLIITTSTGSGKTEGAFLAIRRFGAVTGRPGMVVCLPTQATTNAMWGRGKQFTETVTPSDRPVTLAHSLSGYYEPYREYCADDAAMQWLNGSHKPLLAGMSVVTIDQVLFGALATRFNVLRLWALLGKTLVVDEVHAADPYMLALLGRLLSWCGYLHVPVILLSATLPGHIARHLTQAYRGGAGLEPTANATAPEYPGWAFTSVTGTIQRSSRRAVTAMRARDERTARVEHERYQPGRRIATIVGYAQRVVDEGGCLAVLCSTVPSAQWTFQQLARLVANRVPIRLLHSRFPLMQRRAIEDEVMGWFGKNATLANRKRPRRSILVSTSLVEQSLDIDMDLIVSDLVPMASLLQRLGRAWRHERERHTWITAPTLVVLDPLTDHLPSAWTAMYSPFELMATRQALMDHGAAVVVPQDVSGLVQRVHNEDLPALHERNADAWIQRRDTSARERALAEFVTIPTPDNVGNLCDLTRPQIHATDLRATEMDDVHVATRIGLDSVRLIPQYTGRNGQVWLDPKQQLQFPTVRPSHRRVAEMIEASVPCPASWVAGWPNPMASKWSRTPLIHAMPFSAPRYGDLHLDPDLGLVKGDLTDDL